MRVDLASVRAAIAGEVIAEGDAGYDEARRTFNALVDRRPLAIVRCRDTADVAACLELAREQEVRVSVRGGGHNVAGHAVCDGGLVIDLAPLSAVEVDVEANVARAGGGTTWQVFDAACQAHRLAAPGGTFNTTGIGGLTLGGGIGFLIAQYGLTCDNLRAAEVVLADGSVVRASADEHEDLFWALRGGGGNFGVVTRFEYRLHPVDTCVGGLLWYRVDEMPAALRVFRDVALEAPDDFTLQCVLSSGDGFVNPRMFVMVCSTSSDDEPEPLRLLRAAPGLFDDEVRRLPYLELQSLLGFEFGSRNYWTGHFVRELPDALIDDLCCRFSIGDVGPGSILIEAIQGAARRVAPETTAVGFREAAFNVSALAIWDDPALDEARIAWARETRAAIGEHSLRGGGYLNYMQHDEPLERVRAAFGAKRFERLRAVKRRYDPENVFRSNQNIPPA